MNRILGTVLQGVAIIYGIALVVAGFLVALVESVDPLTGVHSDGLGRILQDGPSMFHSVSTPGFLWELVDTVVFFASLAVIVTVFKAGAKLKEPDAGART